MNKRYRSGVARFAAAGMLLVILWWAVGRATSQGRGLSVVHLRNQEIANLARPGLPTHPDPETRTEAPGDVTPIEPPPRTLTVLAWNIAHGRGDVRQGWTNNWRGGSEEERINRLARMARVIRETGAEIVILNEVDFDSQWSQGIDQAAVLARSGGYPFRVEQRNYDLNLPFFRLAFGNALLTSLPIEGAEWLDIPPHSRLEAAFLGAKAGSVVRLDGPGTCLAVVPVHLEVRSRRTRLGALGAFRNLQAREECPLILAGDFNSAPSGWPGAPGGTVIDSLLHLGLESPRASAEPDPLQMTFPTSDLREARDWILVEPPLQVIRARVLHEEKTLSDHAPVVAVLAVDGDPGRKE